MLFNAVAYYRHPIAGQTRASTKDEGRTSLAAETPEEACRLWVRRLGLDEREAAWKVIVWAREPLPNKNIPVYQGPTIVFQREGIKWREVERRPVV